MPSTDGTFAWLFFTNAMPGASTITLTSNGSTIKAADGSLLDAAGNGTAGSKLTSTFTTVNQARSRHDAIRGSSPIPARTCSRGRATTSAPARRRSRHRR